MDRRDGYGLEVRDWMWDERGLALGHGADLLVYAAIYTASELGVAYGASNEAMGVQLGYPRETVNRALRRLLKANLVSAVGKVGSRRGGRPVPWYVVRQEAIEVALEDMDAEGDARELAGDGPAGEASAEVTRALASRCGAYRPTATLATWSQTVVEDHAEGVWAVPYVLDDARATGVTVRVGMADGAIEVREGRS